MFRNNMIFFYEIILWNDFLLSRRIKNRQLVIPKRILSVIHDGNRLVGYISQFDGKRYRFHSYIVFLVARKMQFQSAVIDRGPLGISGI